MRREQSRWLPIDWGWAIHGLCFEEVEADGCRHGRWQDARLVPYRESWVGVWLGACLLPLLFTLPFHTPLAGHCFDCSIFQTSGSQYYFRSHKFRLLAPFLSTIYAIAYSRQCKPKLSNHLIWHCFGTYKVWRWPQRSTYPGCSLWDGQVWHHKLWTFERLRLLVRHESWCWCKSNALHKFTAKGGGNHQCHRQQLQILSVRDQE